MNRNYQWASVAILSALNVTFTRPPFAAVAPLLPHLGFGKRYIEPCAGDGALIRHLDHEHTCVEASDIEPRRPNFRTYDACTEKFDDYTFDCFVTNPPWDRKLLHPIILNLSAQAPTWLLFDADWMHTRQSATFIPLLRKIVSVGRVKWIPDSKMTGKDNCCWYLFDAASTGEPVFYGRD
ncbi:MAG: hypothetical protein ABW128_19375 [Rhizorhabdus sp.]